MWCTNSRRQKCPPAVFSVDNSGYMCIKDMYDTENMAENKHIAIGHLGEEITTEYLRNRGFTIIDRNYRKKWGEIDIVAKKDSVFHFIEVKAGAVTSDTFPKDGEERYMPEEHVTEHKKARLSRIIQTYLLNRKIKTEWTVDVIVVIVNERTKRAQVRVIKDVLLSGT